MKPEDRVGFWSSLLRSQQQLLVMCKVQSLQTEKAADPLQVTREDLNGLRDQLAKHQERRGADDERSEELNRLRQRVAELESSGHGSGKAMSQDKIAELQQELVEVQNEAN